MTDPSSETEPAAEPPVWYLQALDTAVFARLQTMDGPDDADRCLLDALRSSELLAHRLRHDPAASAPYIERGAIYRLALGDVEGASDALDRFVEAYGEGAGEMRRVQAFATGAEEALAAGRTEAAVRASLRALELSAPGRRGWDDKVGRVLTTAAERSPTLVAEVVEGRAGALATEIEAFRPASAVSGAPEDVAQMKSMLTEYHILETVRARALYGLGDDQRAGEAHDRATDALEDAVFGVGDGDHRGVAIADAWDARREGGIDGVRQFVADRLPVDPGADTIDDAVIRLYATVMDAGSDPALCGVVLAEARAMRSALEERMLEAHERSAAAHRSPDASPEQIAAARSMAAMRARAEIDRRYAKALSDAVAWATSETADDLIAEGERLMSTSDHLGADRIREWAERVAGKEEATGGYGESSLHAVLRAKVLAVGDTANTTQEAADDRFEAVVRASATGGDGAELFSYVDGLRESSIAEAAITGDAAHRQRVAAQWARAMPAVFAAIDEQDMVFSAKQEAATIADPTEAAQYLDGAARSIVEGVRRRVVEAAVDAAFPLDAGEVLSAPPRNELQELLRDDGYRSVAGTVLVERAERMFDQPALDAERQLEDEIALASLCAASVGPDDAGSQAVQQLRRQVAERATTLGAGGDEGAGRPDGWIVRLVSAGLADEAVAVARSRVEGAELGTQRHEEAARTLELVERSVEVAQGDQVDLAALVAEVDRAEDETARRVVAAVVRRASNASDLLADVPDPEGFAVGPLPDDVLAVQPGTSGIDDIIGALLGRDGGTADGIGGSSDPDHPEGPEDLGGGDDGAGGLPVDPGPGTPPAAPALPDELPGDEAARGGRFVVTDAELQRLLDGGSERDVDDPEGLGDDGLII